MSNIRIAICKNNSFFNHSTNWADEWVNYCEKNNLKYEIVDCYNSNAIKKIKKFNILLWHFGNYVLQDMIIARSVLYSAANMGLSIFPDYTTSWHFDDKIAETYLLQSVNAPIPLTKMFYQYNDCKIWLKNKDINLPVVAKLRCGAGSHNVVLLKNNRAIKNYAKKMFSSGIDASPSILYKASSNIKSATNLKTIIKRIKRIPEFIKTFKSAKMFPPEKGYVFLQEFIPNDGYDLKIVVVGDKLSFIGRNIRKGDFRASGGGNLFYDRSLISMEIIDSAFSVNDNLGFSCMGYDYVVNKITGKAIIVEISYGFSHKALIEAGGHFNRQGIWKDEPLNAPVEVLKNKLKTVS